MASRSSDLEIEQRRQRILEYVVEQGEARIDDLTDRFEVSPMTMHRDLDELAARQMLRKLRGRAVADLTLTTETAKRIRECLNPQAKDALAERAAAEVESGQTVFLDDSTTLFPLARRMNRLSDLTVITNSLEIARILGQIPGKVSVQLLGGRYTDFDSCIGPDTIAGLRNIHADVSFVSAAAVSRGKLFHPDREYAELKTTAVASCQRNVLVLDQSKFGKRATYAYGTVLAYDLVIVEERTPAAELDALDALNVPVALVDIPGAHVAPTQP